MAGPKDFIMNGLMSLQSLEKSLPVPLPPVSQSLMDLTAALPDLPAMGNFGMRTRTAGRSTFAPPGARVTTI